jgi:hypothetical protein
MPTGASSSAASAADVSGQAGAVVDVLREVHAPIRPRAVLAAVEQRLGRPVSGDTIGSDLSVAARAAATPVIGSGPGLYALARSAAHKRRL